MDCYVTRRGRKKTAITSCASLSIQPSCTDCLHTVAICAGDESVAGAGWPGVSLQLKLFPMVGKGYNLVT